MKITIHGRKFIIMFILLYAGSAFLLILKRNGLAEKTCNIAFGFLMVGILLRMFGRVKSE